MSIKINKLEIENVKRVKAIRIEPSTSGLTVIGGKNNQGKTSVLDAIAWALGGKGFAPSNPKREGSLVDPILRVELSNGLIVERKGKNSDLKVLDPSGNTNGQTLLNKFVEQLALNLPKFMEQSSKDKAKTLLQIIGVGDKLYELENVENKLYNSRLEVGRIADQKKKYAAEQPQYPEAPTDIVSASELIKLQQDILARNGENNRKRQNLEYIEGEFKKYSDLVNEYMDKLKVIEADLETAKKSALDLHDESTAELEESISNVEEINRKVRANLDKEKAEEDAQNFVKEYDSLTAEIESVRKKKFDLLDGAELPLPGLSVDEGELTYNNQKWDNMSGSEQLKVATAIVRKLNPDCGFVLIDKLEQMDLESLNDFGQWLEKEGLQAIATRVSSGDECSIIIEDGYVVGQTRFGEDDYVSPSQPIEEKKGWEF